jgi:RNA polymerase sigma factor (sigma-70 family)
MGITRDLTAEIDAAYESGDEYKLFDAVERLAEKISRTEDTGIRANDKVAHETNAHDMTSHLIEQLHKNKFTPNTARLSSWAITVLKNKLTDLIRERLRRVETNFSAFGENGDDSDFEDLRTKFLSGRTRFYAPGNEEQPVSYADRATTAWRAFTRANRKELFPSREAYTIFDLEAEGKSRAEIAERLGIKVRTLDKKREKLVKQIRANIFSQFSTELSFK